MASRIMPFVIGVGTVSLAYGNLRDDIFQQQRTIRAKLSSSSPENDSPSRTAILSELDNQRRSLFQKIGDEWNFSVLSLYQTLAGTRPK
jgi:hypothetical protein